MSTGIGTRTADLLAMIAGGVTVHDLARPYQQGMPQSPNHPQYMLSLPRRHGDSVRDDGGSAANDLIVLGTHVGTHIDALAHVSQDGLLFGGIDARAAQVGGRFLDGGVHEVPPMLCRGLLLDVPAALDSEGLEGGYEITPADLEATMRIQGVSPEPGDVVLVRSGWGRHWHDEKTYLGAATGVPGVSAAGATWLADQQVRAIGADTIAFERLAPGSGHGSLPAHRVLLVERGINIIETLDLDQLAADGAYEFLFVLSALKLVGATGSPVRPLAVSLPGRRL